MANKHTPGLYSIQDCRDFIQQEQKLLILGPVKADTGGQPVLATILVGNVPAGEAEANAKLFAAAPELLEALKSARSFIIDVAKDFGQIEIPDFIESLDAAIAKAEDELPDEAPEPAFSDGPA